MNIEGSINSFLNRIPFIKRGVKRIYQLLSYALSPKIKFEGDIKRISPKDGKEYFFGYYDKSPWDKDNRYMLCLRVDNTYTSVAPSEEAEIVIFDTENKNSYEVIAKTKAWNVQQGCMLQWLGPKYDENIIYNDFRSGKYCSVILNIKTKEEKIIGMPVYSVSNDGKFALTLDFSRLHRLRKGYGYSNIEEGTKDEKCPNSTCIWKINLEDGSISELMKYSDFLNFETRDEMKGAEHKVNHIMINPAGSRFMVLHRWFRGNNKYSRLITVNMDGTEMYNLSDDNMVSHCCWKNDHYILGYERKSKTGNGYYLMKDKSNEYTLKFEELSSDGHPSYSPSGNGIITDTYPNRARMASVYYIKNNNIRRIARVFAPFKYDNDVRCDLHPRWDREGIKVCFDSVFEGRRGLYVIKLDS